jgi:fructokinase
MTRTLVAGIETGGTKILVRLCDRDSGEVVGEGRWATDSADRAAADLLSFLTSAVPDGYRIDAVGMAAFGPLIVDRSSPAYGQVQATTKPGWAGSNLRKMLEARLGVPVAVDTDVNAAAIAEQAFGAGERLPSVAYVTVGTGIGAGLAINGRSMFGALHPEAGHLRLVRRSDDQVPSVCSFHADCAEGLASGPAVRCRLGEGRTLAGDPALQDLVTDYLGQLAAALVLAWSPHRIVWGGGVIGGASLIEAIEASMRSSLGGYGVGPAIEQAGFCAPARLENAGLEGALLMARDLASTARPVDEGAG